jgi:hypothetical protein
MEALYEPALANPDTSREEVMETLKVFYLSQTKLNLHQQVQDYGGCEDVLHEPALANSDTSRLEAMEL